MRIRAADVEPRTVYLVHMLGLHGCGTFTCAATGLDPDVGPRSDGHDGAPWHKRLLHVRLHAVRLPDGVDAWPADLDDGLRHRLTGGRPASWRWLDTVTDGDYPLDVLAVRICSLDDWPQVAAALLAKRMRARGPRRAPQVVGPQAVGSGQ